MVLDVLQTKIGYDGYVIVSEILGEKEKVLSKKWMSKKDFERLRDRMLPGLALEHHLPAVYVETSYWRRVEDLEQELESEFAERGASREFYAVAFDNDFLEYLGEITKKYSNKSFRSTLSRAIGRQDDLIELALNSIAEKAGVTYTHIKNEFSEQKTNFKQAHNTPELASIMALQKLYTQSYSSST
ncbi:MAG: hypothetical protein GOU99_00775 [Candidatus Altiarchaeota archaeon]|nr:hypothetical protein [Candidatus Altiarchaeota archaeon]